MIYEPTSFWFWIEVAVSLGTHQTIFQIPSSGPHWCYKLTYSTVICPRPSHDHVINLLLEVLCSPTHLFLRRPGQGNPILGPAVSNDESSLRINPAYDLPLPVKLLSICNLLCWLRLRCRRFWIRLHLQYRLFLLLLWHHLNLGLRVHFRLAFSPPPSGTSFASSLLTWSHLLSSLSPYLTLKSSSTDHALYCIVL